MLVCSENIASTLAGDKQDLNREFCRTILAPNTSRTVLKVALFIRSCCRNISSGMVRS